MADLDALYRALQPHADAVQAASMRRYMRDQFDFLGVPAPQRRAAQKAWLGSWKGADGDALMAIAHELWARPERELQYVACDLLRRYSRRLQADHLPGLQSLVTSCSWWDTVDLLAAHPIGAVVRRCNAASVMDAWVASDNLWVVRSALLHQLSYRADVDLQRLFHYCRMHQEHPDFFIRKAIGWALRSSYKEYPREVVAFVKQAALSPLSRREALKHHKTA